MTWLVFVELIWRNRDADGTACPAAGMGEPRTASLKRAQLMEHRARQMADASHKPWRVRLTEAGN